MKPITSKRAVQKADRKQGCTSSLALSSLPSLENRTFSQSKEQAPAPRGLQSLYQAHPHHCRQEVCLQDCPLTPLRSINPSLLRACLSTSSQWDTHSRLHPSCSSWLTSHTLPTLATFIQRSQNNYPITGTKFPICVLNYIQEWITRKAFPTASHLSWNFS